MPAPQPAATQKPLPLYMLGGDPEVFIKSMITGKVTTSCDKIGGTKEKGIKFGNSKDGLSILEDNVAVEFNFKPATDYITFSYRINAILSQGEQYVRSKANCTLYPAATHEFAGMDLMEDKANIFGCDPDFEAYGQDNPQKPTPREVDISNVGRNRFCGGHLHLGFENKEKIPAYAVAQLMDMCVGLTSVKYDRQGLRRKHYGMAGLFRVKPYGIEYRTMSNWWLRPEHADAAQRMALEVFCLMEYMDHRVADLGKVYEKMPLQDVRASINAESVRDCMLLQSQFRAYCTEVGLSLGGTFRAL